MYYSVGLDLAGERVGPEVTEQPDDCSVQISFAGRLVFWLNYTQAEALASELAACMPFSNARWPGDELPLS